MGWEDMFLSFGTSSNGFKCAQMRSWGKEKSFVHPLSISRIEPTYTPKMDLGESGSHLYRLSSSILVLKPSKRNLKTSFPQACRYDPSGRLTWLSSGHCVIGLIEASTVAAESWALQNSSPQTELQSQLQSQLQRSAELKSILMYK